MSILEIVLLSCAGVGLVIWAVVLFIKAKKKKNKPEEEEGEKYE